MDNRRGIGSILHLFFLCTLYRGRFNALTIDPIGSTIHVMVFQTALPTSSHVIPVLDFDCPAA